MSKPRARRVCAAENMLETPRATPSHCGKMKEPTLSQTWKEEVELPPAPPSPAPANTPLPPASAPFALCLQRLSQAPSHAFCRIAKQQWGLPSQKQKHKLLHANTRALLHSLEAKANPALPKGQHIWPLLEHFWEAPLHPQLKSLTNKLALLCALLSDLDSPDSILPEHPAVATLPSLHQELARDFPVEYARALCALAGPAGESTMLGGAALRLAEAAPFVYSVSVSSALMEANFYGYLLHRSAFDSLLDDTFANPTHPAQHASLSPWLLTPLIRQLFGIGYATQTFWSPQEASASLLHLARLPSSLPNRPLVFSLAPAELQPPLKLQAVLFEAVREERVFFRNQLGKLFSLPDRNFAMCAASLSFPI